MEEKRWESCNAEALLEEFFSQDDLRQLALSTGELLGCPLLVLDDTFHIAAHHLPLGFSDALFETAVRRGEISYEAGAIISRNPMLTAGWADYVQLADSPYRRRFAPLVSAGVRLGCLICVDTDGHLEKIPPQTWELVERILAKQLFVEASHQDKPFETAEDILMHLLDGGFSSAAHFQLQASGTYLADFHPLTFALIDLEAYHNAYMGKRHLREELETQIPDAHPFLYKGDIFLFLHREGDADTLSTLAKEFQLKILVSEPLDELFHTQIGVRLLLLHHPNYYMEQSYFGGPAFVYRFSKDCASRKKTVLWDFAPSQVSIPFLTLLEKSVDTSPLLLICPYRVSGKIYIYLYRTHQYISRFLLRPMFHLHCPFTLYSP